MSQPNQEVLQAFGLLGPVSPMPGGRGLCYTSTCNTVLKPSDDDDEAQYVARLSKALSKHPSPVYRISQPKAVVKNPDVFVHRGWTAWSFLDGAPSPKPRFAEILRVSRALHADVATLAVQKPHFLAAGRNRWQEADRVIWDEKSLCEVKEVSHKMMALLQPVLDRLELLKQPLRVEDTKSQLIHGDLTGNVLFDDDRGGAVLGIIDLTPYWKPAIYAEAIVVADGLIWHGEGMSLIEEHYGTDTMRIQLLVRALHWRCLTFAIDPDFAWIESNLPRADMVGAVDVLSSVLN